MSNNKITDFFKEEIFVKPAKKVMDSSGETRKNSSVASKIGAIKGAVSGSKVVSIATEKGAKVASVVTEKGAKVASVVTEKGAKVASAVTSTGAKIGSKITKSKEKKEVLVEFDDLTETEKETNNIFELVMESMITICEKNNVSESELDEILINFKENISEEEINKIKESKKRVKDTEKIVVKYIGNITSKREKRKIRKVIVK